MKNDNLFIRKALDSAFLSEKYSSLRATGFLDPKEQSDLKKELPLFTGIRTEFCGGFPDAERRMFVSIPLWDETPHIPISVLEITGRDIKKLTHRDYLGSVLALGLKREKIGDILVGEDKTYMFTAEDIGDYVCESLIKVASQGVHVKKIELDSFEVPEPKFQEICGSVASFRLDAVLAMALHESRSAIQRLIESERVSVNFEIADSISKTLHEGDKISVRGYGKMIFAHIGGTSKKGRSFITIKRYI